MYYADKLDTLQDLFGTSDVRLNGSVLQVKSSRYPVVDDVIVLSPTEHYSPQIRRQLGITGGPQPGRPSEFAEDIQFSFGEEWSAYDQILVEHEREFLRYFDLVDLGGLRDSRVCDLGCGGGRWSYFLKDHCRELVLLDFSDAIFVARRNLRATPRTLFFHCDLTTLPFRQDFADFLLCLGVLHHLPAPCLEEVRRLRWWAPRNLVFLYYALDNRPVYFRWLLKLVTGIRLALSRIRHRRLRSAIVRAGTLGVYVPLIGLGRALRPFGLSRHVPLYDFYHDKSKRRIEQDVYDRFFTRIEQRVTRREILTLRDTYRGVTVSDQLPYWHFLCER